VPSDGGSALFYSIHTRGRRPDFQTSPQFREHALLSDGVNLNASIWQIVDITSNAQLGSGALDEIAEAHSLDSS